METPLFGLGIEHYKSTSPSYAVGDSFFNDYMDEPQTKETLSESLIFDSQPISQTALDNSAKERHLAVKEKEIELRLLSLQQRAKLVEDREKEYDRQLAELKQKLQNANEKTMNDSNAQQLLMEKNEQIKMLDLRVKFLEQQVKMHQEAQKSTQEAVQGSQNQWSTEIQSMNIILSKKDGEMASLKKEMEELNKKLSVSESKVKEQKTKMKVFEKQLESKDNKISKLESALHDQKSDAQNQLQVIEKQQKALNEAQLLLENSKKEIEKERLQLNELRNSNDIQLREMQKKENSISKRELELKHRLERLSLHDRADFETMKEDLKREQMKLMAESLELKKKKEDIEKLERQTQRAEEEMKQRLIHVEREIENKNAEFQRREQSLRQSYQDFEEFKKVIELERQKIMALPPSRMQIDNSHIQQAYEDLMKSHEEDLKELEHRHSTSVRALETEIIQLKETIQKYHEKDALIEALRTELTEKRLEIEGLLVQLARTNDEVDRLTVENSGKVQEINSLTVDAHDKYQTRIKELQEKLAHLQKTSLKRPILASTLTLNQVKELESAAGEELRTASLSEVMANKEKYDLLKFIVALTSTNQVLTERIEDMQKYVGTVPLYKSSRTPHQRLNRTPGSIRSDIELRPRSPTTEYSEPFRRRGLTRKTFSDSGHYDDSFRSSIRQDDFSFVSETTRRLMMPSEVQRWF